MKSWGVPVMGFLLLMVEILHQLIGKQQKTFSEDEGKQQKQWKNKQPFEDVLLMVRKSG